MYATNNDSKVAKTLAERRKQERAEREAMLKAKCNTWAIDRFGEEMIKQWSNKYKGIFYLPVLDDDDNILACLVLRPIDRYILSYASTKLESEGLWLYLEACMRDLMIDGDQIILDDEEYFFAAAQQLDKIMGARKAALVKR